MLLHHDLNILIRLDGDERVQLLIGQLILDLEIVRDSERDREVADERRDARLRGGRDGDDPSVSADVARRFRLREGEYAAAVPTHHTELSAIRTPRRDGLRAFRYGGGSGGDGGHGGAILKLGFRSNLGVLFKDWIFLKIEIVRVLDFEN